MKPLDEIKKYIFPKKYENELEFLELREKISNELQPLLKNSEEACWNFYTESSEDNLTKMNESQDEINNFYDNKEIYEKLKSIVDKGGVLTKKYQKQLKQLKSSFGDGIEFKKEIMEMCKKENEIAQKLNSYTMTIDNKPISKAEIQKILEEEKNVNLRQKAFYSKIKSGDLIANDLIELVKMRNDFAHKKGYKDYFTYKLKEDYNITPNELSKLLKEVKSRLNGAIKKVTTYRKNKLAKEFNITSKDLKNYHFGLLEQDNPEKIINNKINAKEEIVELAIQAYKNMGFDVRNLPITLDLYPRDKKNTHGFSFPIEAGKDARILANLTNNITSLDTLLHELGHSVFTVMTDSKLPFFEQDTTSTMTEAVAMMMGDLPRAERILDFKSNDEINNDFYLSLGTTDTNFISSSMTIIKFEMEMYKNPKQDLKQLWKNLSVQYKGRNSNDDNTNEWATIPHFLSHPAYYQNYFRAALIKAQLYNALCKKFNKLTSCKECGKYLTEHLFQYGGSKEDNEILLDITSAKLSAKTFCKRTNKLISLNKKLNK